VNAEELAGYLRDKLGESVADAHVAYGQLTLTLVPEALPEAARMCKQDERLAFDFFDFMAGVDEKEDGFAVITHLYSLRHRHHVQLRALAPGGRETPELPTISDVYRGANWHEREAYDMFGIAFTGHPGLEPRILTVENFEGWPLRKDFLLTTREAKPWPGAKEPQETPKAGERSGDGAAAQEPRDPEDKAAAAKAKAERAKQKAAQMRAKKAAERAAEAAGGGSEAAQTPGGAAQVAGSDIAADAAAGAVGGDTGEGATQDARGADDPVDDPEAEATLGEGARPEPGASPGETSEGSHAGDADAPPSAGAPSAPADSAESDPERAADERAGKSDEARADETETDDADRGEDK
jgi:NADH-quinone oxidoreductase subunit C